MSTENHPPSFVAPSISDLEPLFPSYRLEGFLAQGGMGAVYKAVQTSLQRPVAIKILPREFGDDENFREAFTAEARAMASLNHPALIGVYDFGDVDGMLFIVMEYVGGGSLHDASHDQFISSVRASRLVSVICRGLAHAHEGGVLHRDIKPANILLTEDGSPKIGDFGLARRIGEHLDHGEAVYGTPGYAAPEVCHGGAVDHRSDIFSVGVLLHRLLTGLEPDGGFLPVASGLCDCPPRLDAIISKATQADPALRYQHVADMATDLEGISNGSAQSAGAKLQLATGTNPLRPQAPVKRKSPAGTIAASLLILVVVGAIAFFASRPPAPAPVVQEPDEPEVVIPTPAPKPITPKVELPPAPEEVAPVESPLEALARLQPALLEGKRNEFPAGTQARNGSHYLIIEEPKTWNDASRFAQDHGAHLAVLPDPGDQSWIKEQFPNTQSCWVGAGTAANNAWQWVDSSPWTAPSTFPADPSSNHFVAFSPTKGLIPASSSATFGFALQWRDDGTNPGTTEAQLQRMTRATDSEQVGDPSYPVGTRTLDSSHFLPLHKSMSWDEARALAESAGAHLAVPSSREEHTWICSTFTESLRDGTILWLGGYQPKAGQRWQWLTKEPWNNHGWQPLKLGPNKMSQRLALQQAAPGNAPHWIPLPESDDKADGALLEWSTPGEPQTLAPFNLQTWLEGVNKIFATRVGSELDEYEKSRKALVDDYSRDMTRLVRRTQNEVEAIFFPGRGGRGGTGEIVRALEKLQDDIKEAAKKGELLPELPFGTPNDIRERHTKSTGELSTLNETYDQKLKDQLSYYLDGLTKRIGDLVNNGDIDPARDLQQYSNPLQNNVAGFVKALFPNSPRGTLPWTSPAP